MTSTSRVLEAAGGGRRRGGEGRGRRRVSVRLRRARRRDALRFQVAQMIVLADHAFDVTELSIKVVEAPPHLLVSGIVAHTFVFLLNLLHD